MDRYNGKGGIRPEEGGPPPPRGRRAPPLPYPGSRPRPACPRAPRRRAPGTRIPRGPLGSYLPRQRRGPRRGLLRSSLRQPVGPRKPRGEHPGMKLREYEAMFLLDNASAVADLDGTTGVVDQILLKHGATIVQKEKWDERKLAYEIRGHKRATYYLVYFRAPGAGRSRASAPTRRWPTRSSGTSIARPRRADRGARQEARRGARAPRRGEPQGEPRGRLGRRGIARAAVVTTTRAVATSKAGRSTSPPP